MKFSRVTIFSAIIGAAICVQTASPVLSAESSTTSLPGFSQLHHEDSNTPAPTFSQKDVSSFFANLRQELKKPENSTHRHTILIKSMEQYRESVRALEVQTHFQCVEYLIKVFTLNVMADTYGMVSTPFFNLEKVSLDSTNVIRLILESGLSMSQFDGGLMNNPQANASAGLHAMYWVQENPNTPDNIKSTLAAGWMKSYHSPNWAQSLKAVQEALQKSLELAPGK